MNAQLCACGRPVGTAPIVTNDSGEALCDGCVQPGHLAQLDQLRAFAQSCAGKAPDDEAQAWLRVALQAYCDLGHHAMVDPLTSDDRFVFFVWVQVVDPDGWAEHRAALVEDR